ncbi:MAG TPA: redoxin domain-containing protein [Phycisphaerae bacterium]|jgi:peroxiredoxin|nr:redoxin domain-containing protein [Phycisphaerae bacterium]
MRALATITLPLLLAACAAPRPAPTTQPAAFSAGPDIMDKAPDFTLPDIHGGNFHLADAEKRGPVLMIFYLGYECPRCVAGLRDIESQLNAIRATGTQVVAISPDTFDDLKKSADAFGDFPFPLLADPQQQVFRAYGLVFGAGQDATVFHGCYIADKDGNLAFAMKSSHPYDNMPRLLETLRGLNDGK